MKKILLILFIASNLLAQSYITIPDTSWVRHSITGFHTPKPTDKSGEVDMGVRTITANIPHAVPNDTVWVRPLGGSYGTENGSTYANAYDGFGDVSALALGDVLMIRGTHTEDLVIATDFANGTVTNYVIIDGGKGWDTDAGIINSNAPIANSVNNYVAIRNITVKNATSSGVSHVSTVHHIILDNVTSYNSGNQAYQQKGTSSVKYYDCIGYGNTDDGFSLHDTSTAWYYNCVAYDNAEGINIIRSTTATIYGCDYYSNSSHDIAVQGADGVGTVSMINYYSTYEKTPTVEVNCVYTEDVQGLRSSYNMISSSSQVLTDVSGNGNNGTNYNTSSTYNSQLYNATNAYTEIPDDNSIDFPDDFSIEIKFNANDVTEKGTLYNKGIVSTVQNFVMIRLKSGALQIFVGDGSGTYYMPLTSATVVVGVTYHCVLVVDRTDGYSVYVNGIKADSSSTTTSVDLSNSLDAFIGGETATTNLFNGQILNLSTYNIALNEAQIQAKYNATIEPQIVENFDYTSDGEIFTNWIGGTGVYTVDTATISGVLSNTLDCSTAGTIALQSETAYGTWEFDVLKGADGNSSRIAFIDTDKIVFSSGDLVIYLTTAEEVKLLRDGGTTILASASSYINNNQWYHVKVTRTTDGEFYMWMDGVLVSVSGGSGTNPITYAGNTTSSYLTIDNDAGDRIANIRILSGVEQ